MKRPLISFTLLSAALFALTACSEEPMGQACTEAGCSDVITLDIVDEQGEPIGGFSGTVTINDEEIVIDCDDPRPASYYCEGGSVLVLYAAAESITVNLVSTANPDVFYQGTLDLEPEEFYPNGEDCPPVCLQSTTTVTLFHSTND